jgi:Uncharacterised nucleotidyltransferase
MTSESKFLLATLQRGGAVAPASIDWQTVLELADSHGVLPLFCKNYSGKLPETFASRLRSQWIGAAALTSELEGLLEQFCVHGLEVLPLKGPLLAHALYGSPCSRSSDDLDLLVRRRDFNKARSLLIDLGFEPVYQADDYHQTFQRRNTCLELHFSVAPPTSPSMDLDLVWDRARVVEFRQQRTRFFSNPDLLIYLIVHGVKHEFARLIWVLDVARVLASLGDEELDEVFKMAKALGIEGALLTTCELAQYSSDTMLPARVAAAIARQPAISARAHALWERIVGCPANPQTAHQGAALFVRLEPNARSRWAQRLRCFQPSQQDHLWAQQHNIHAHWMLFFRPLRLLSKHGPKLAWRILFPRLEAKPPIP